MKQMSRIKKAFPNLSSGFYDILLERIKQANFTNKRLEDAVNNLIDNYKYPTPPISAIISFDKKIKVYTYNDILEMVSLGGDYIFQQFEPVKIYNGTKPFWASVIDIQTYNIERHDTKHQQQSKKS